jgi:hypothetical protein
MPEIVTFADAGSFSAGDFQMDFPAKLRGIFRS